MESSGFAGTKRRGGKAHKKCDDCRRKKIKCLPAERDWSIQEKCHSCERSGHKCGPNRRFNDGPLPPPTPRPPSEVGLGIAASLTTPCESNPNQTLSGEGDVDFEENGTRIKEAITSTSTKSVAAQTIPASPVQLSSRPIPGKTADNSNLSRRLTHLGHLRIDLENIKGLERHLGPQAVTEEAKDIKYNLKNKEWCISREYSKCFKEQMEAAEGEDLDRAKLTYLELLQDVNSIDEDRASFADVRAVALQRLIKIYRDEGNLPAVERMWKQLADPRYPLQGPDNAEIATKLADCYLQISAEGRKVFEDLDLRVEAPLHSSSGSLFPALHRALRCGDDNVSRVLCTTEVTLMELDMLGQNTVIAAAATGKTALLGPILSCKPQLLAGRDVLDRTALFHATHKGDFDSYLILARAGANIHDRDASGLPIISVAVARGCVKIVRDLLERGASPNPPPVGLPSPLHDAVEAGNLEMCEVLLAKGAWVDWRSPPDGKTPCQVAREKGFDAIATILERASQQPENHFPQFQSTQPKLNQQDNSGKSVSKTHAHDIGAFDYRAFRPAAVTPQEPSLIVQQTPSAFLSAYLDHEPEHGQHTPERFTTDSPSWINTYITSSTGTNTNSVVDEQEYGEVT